MCNNEKFVIFINKWPKMSSLYKYPRWNPGAECPYIPGGTIIILNLIANAIQDVDRLLYNYKAKPPPGTFYINLLH
jgi:hypothetical protein